MVVASGERACPQPKLVCEQVLTKETRVSNNTATNATTTTEPRPLRVRRARRASVVLQRQGMTDHFHSRNLRSTPLADGHVLIHIEAWSSIPRATPRATPRAERASADLIWTGHATLQVPGTDADARGSGVVRHGFGEHASLVDLADAIQQRYGITVDTRVRQYMYASPSTLARWRSTIDRDYEDRACFYAHDSASIETIDGHCLGTFDADGRFAPNATTDDFGWPQSLVQRVADESRKDHAMRAGLANREWTAWLMSELAKDEIPGVVSELVQYDRSPEAVAYELARLAAQGLPTYPAGALTTQIAIRCVD